VEVHRSQVCVLRFMRALYHYIVHCLLALCCAVFSFELYDMCTICCCASVLLALCACMQGLTLYFVTHHTHTNTYTVITLHATTTTTTAATLES
jgi:hypothetical protein